MMSRISRGWVFLLAAIGLLVPVLAIQANLAGIVDWHNLLIGAPLLEPSPPSLVDTVNGRKILAITKKNVLACLDAISGDIAWRYLLDDVDPVVSYHVQDDDVLLLSGPSAATARLFSLSTGQVRWERTLLLDLSTVHFTVPVHLGTDATFAEDEDGPSVVTLSDGRRVSKLSLTDGTVHWSLEAPGVGSTVLFKQLLVSESSIHVLALTSSFASTTLTTLSLSLKTSAPLSDLTQIPSFISNPAEALLAVGSAPGSARVVWLEHGRIRSTYLSADGQLGDPKDLLPGKGHLYASMDGQGRRRGFLLGSKGNGATQIIDVRRGGRIVDEFDASQTSPDRSPSVYTVSAAKSGTTFTRVYWSFNMNLAVVQTYNVAEDASAIAVGFTFPFDTASHGIILSAAASSTASPAQLPQILLSTSSGAVQLVSQDGAFWAREEGLTDIVAARFIDLGEREVEEIGHLLTEESFVQRSTRHVTEMVNLPTYLLPLTARMSASVSTSSLAAPTNSTDLHRDQFGFQKLLVAATRHGKLFALDTFRGTILWTRNLGLLTESPEMSVERMWSVREVGEDISPTLAVMATRVHDEHVSTVLFHIDAFTGVVKGDKDPQSGLPLGKVLEGKAKTAFLTPFENCDSKNRILAVVDQQDQLYIFPKCKKMAGKIATMEPGLFFTLSETNLNGASISGRVPSSLDDMSMSTSTLWSIVLPVGEQLQSIEAADSGAIASYGRVLGDKQTLYKYLNPHLQVITTISPNSGKGNVYVIDTTTGRGIHSISLSDVVVTKGIKAVMSENWLVYSWLSGNGWRIGSVELYEHRLKSKAETPGLSSLASGHDIYSYAQTFIAPGEIKALALTSSRFGITAKELVFVNERNQIASIPRKLLDPRRPVVKPTSGDKEEMLIPYDPVIAHEPKRVVSHKYQVLGVTGLISSPALVESTSLLFAHGLDLFLTRGLTPSGTFDILSDNFNKPQLLLTLAVLSVGIAVARPAVQRKRLKERWY